MANQNNKPDGSGKAETKDTQGGKFSGMGEEQARAQNTGQKPTKAPEPGRSDTARGEGTVSRDGATSGKTEGMRKDSMNSDRNEINRGDVTAGVSRDGARGMEGSADERDETM